MPKYNPPNLETHPEQGSAAGGARGSGRRSGGVVNSAQKQRAKKLFRRAIKVGSDVAEVAVQLKAATSPLGIAVVAAKAVDSVLTQFENESAVQRADPFCGWTNVRCQLDFFVFQMLKEANLVRPAIKDDPATSLPGFRAGLGPCISRLGDVEIAWNDSGAWVDGPWVQYLSDADPAAEALSNFVWEHVGTRLQVAERHRRLWLVEDPLVDSLPSSVARELTERVEKFNSQGYSRAILLHGEPGTGKSYVLREVGKNVGGKTLRLSPDELCDVNPAPLIAFLRPDAVLIDDFERVEDAEQVLKHFEQVRATTKLFMVTVNALNKLDRAVLRPGRIDEVIEVTKLDQHIIDAMLEGLEGPQREIMQEIPMAYISHFARTREVLGIEAAFAEIEELAERMERIKDMGVDQDRPRVRRLEAVAMLRG